MSKRVLVPVADGCEELEAVAIIDVLRRAGADVAVASVDTIQVTASRGVKLVADRLIGQCTEETFDLIALPGGMPGAEHLRDCPGLQSLLKEQARAGRFYAAICASPAVVLLPLGLLQGKKATCHPLRAQQMPDPEAAKQAVVMDGNCITSQGPGTAIAFALKLVEALYGKEKAAEVAGPMIVP